MPARAGTLQSVDAALRLISLLGERPSLSVVEVANELGLAQSTAHRLLATLRARGFAAQDAATRRYGAGWALLQLSDSFQRIDLRHVSRPRLVELSQELGETTNLIVLEQRGVRYIEVVESEQRLRVTSRVGELRPAHLTASGKVLLAELAPSELDALFPDEFLGQAATAESITTKAALLAELAEVRKTGYATNHGQTLEGVSAVAMPVHSRQRQALGAVAVSAPTVRLSPERFAPILSALRRTVLAIEQDLAGQPKPMKLSALQNMETVSLLTGEDTD